MRWVLAALLLLVPGCISGSPAANVFNIGQDCSSNQQTVVATSGDVLLPATMPASMRESFGPRAVVSVTAREGQSLLAVATWAPSAGEVEVLFDGPGTNQATTDYAWTSQGEVEAGDYTLELVGDPMAFEVTYTLYISATGCTPVDA
jgi:ABC-type uncharacterized transport system auxiliary subunit